MTPKYMFSLTVGTLKSAFEIDFGESTQLLCCLGLKDENRFNESNLIAIRSFHSRYNQFNVSNLQIFYLALYNITLWYVTKKRLVCNQKNITLHVNYWLLQV